MSKSESIEATLKIESLLQNQLELALDVLKQISVMPYQARARRAARAAVAMIDEVGLQVRPLPKGLKNVRGVENEKRKI